MAESQAPMPKPVTNRDFDFFYDGLQEGRLLVQSCDACAALRCPPGPACPSCHSFAWTPHALAGTGALYSYTVHHHPPLAGYATPLPVALVALDEGIRMIGPMDMTPAEALHIGMKVETRFVERDGVAGFRFIPAGSPA